MLRIFGVAALIAGSLLSDSTAWQVPNAGGRDPGAYAVVLSDMLPKPSSRKVVVRATPIAIPRLRGSAPTWLGQFADVPRPLVEAIERVESSDDAFDASAFPERVQLVPEETIRQFFTNHDVGHNWLAFKEALQSDGWLAFSEVLLTDDDRDALLYAEEHCGGLCGEGSYFWLHRESRVTSWRVARRVPSWIS